LTTRSTRFLRSHLAGLLIGLGLATGVVYTCAACRQQASAQESAGRVQPSYDAKTGKLTKLAYDSNANGKEDTWAYMDGARLVRLEADENEDGKIDRWEYYPAGPATGPKQAPDRIERATRADGRVSRREFFEKGALVRIEEDTDGNGAIDKWETYTEGALSVLALDTSGRGKPDRRLIYRADGRLDRVEADPTGSGDFQPLNPPRQAKDPQAKGPEVQK